MPSSAAVVMLVLVKPNGSIADSIVESAGDRRGFEGEILRLVRASPINARRVGNQPVACWEVPRRTLEVG